MGVKERIGRMSEEMQEFRRLPSEEVTILPDSEEAHQNPFHRYEETRTEAYREQKNLFNQLRQMGIIGMLEEMTDRDITYPNPTQQIRMRKLVSEGKGLKLDSAWRARIVPPSMKRDLTADPSLEIILDSGVKLGAYESRTSIGITYSQDRLLMIEGHDKVFEKTVDNDNIDELREEIEESVASAFIKPKHFIKAPSTWERTDI